MKLLNNYQLIITLELTLCPEVCIFYFESKTCFKEVLRELAHEIYDVKYNENES